MSQSESVLKGKGKNDYEKYLRIVDLLACQKTPEAFVHHDELMFQIVHQTAELWMKLQIHEIEEARTCIQQEDCLSATRFRAARGPRSRELPSGLGSRDIAAQRVESLLAAIKK